MRSVYCTVASFFTLTFVQAMLTVVAKIASETARHQQKLEPSSVRHWQQPAGDQDKHGHHPTIPSSFPFLCRLLYKVPCFETPQNFAQWLTQPWP